MLKVLFLLITGRLLKAAVYHYSLRDYTGEYSNLDIPVTEPTEVGANWETVINTEEATLRSAIQGVTLANIARHYVRLSEETVNDTQPASAFAQRELGLRIFYHDTTTGEKMNRTIAAPDLASLTLQDGTDLVDLTAEPMASLVSAWETYVESDDGNAVEVDRAVVVGRNN